MSASSGSYDWAVRLLSDPNELVHSAGLALPVLACKPLPSVSTLPVSQTPHLLNALSQFLELSKLHTQGARDTLDLIYHICSADFKIEARIPGTAELRNAAVFNSTTFQPIGYGVGHTQRRVCTQ